MHVENSFMTWTHLELFSVILPEKVLEFLSYGPQNHKGQFFELRFMHHLKAE